MDIGRWAAAPVSFPIQEPGCPSLPWDGNPWSILMLVSTKPQIVGGLALKIQFKGVAPWSLSLGPCGHNKEGRSLSLLQAGSQPSLPSHWMRRTHFELCRTHWECHVPLPCHGGSHPLRTRKRCCWIHRENQQGGVWICHSKCFHGPKNWEMSPPAAKEPLEY